MSGQVTVKDPASAPDPVDQAVGAALRQLRRSRKVRMATLARHLGLSYQQIVRRAKSHERSDLWVHE